MKTSGFDRSLGSRENKGFLQLTNNGGALLFTTSFNGNEVPIMLGPALEKKGVSSLTGLPYTYMNSIIWIPNKNGPGRGAVVPLEEYKQAFKDKNEEYMKKLVEMGIPSIEYINKKWLA
jgi:hypothetical protein